jgi:hypothetical protein
MARGARSPLSAMAAVGSHCSSAGPVSAPTTWNSPWGRAPTATNRTSTQLHKLGHHEAAGQT